MEDEELLAGVPDDVVADSTEDMLASSTAVPDATPTADADQMAVEGDPPAAGSTEGGDNGKGSTRFSGKRKIIEHTLPADAMMGVDVNSPEECAKRQGENNRPPPTGACLNHLELLLAPHSSPCISCHAARARAAPEPLFSALHIAAEFLAQCVLRALQCIPPHFHAPSHLSLIHISEPTRR